MRNNQIKLTQYDDTKKIAHDSQIVRAIENLKLSYGGLSQWQASGKTNRLKLYVRAVIKYEAWPAVVQLKRRP